MNKYLVLSALGLIMLAMAFLLSYQMGIFQDFQFSTHSQTPEAILQEQGVSSVIGEVPPPDSEEARKLTLGEPSPPPRPSSASSTPLAAPKDAVSSKSQGETQPVASEMKPQESLGASDPATPAGAPQVVEGMEYEEVAAGALEEERAKAQSELLEMAEKARDEAQSSQLTKPEAEPISKPLPQAPEKVEAKVEPSSELSGGEPATEASDEDASLSGTGSVESIVVSAQGGSVVMTIKTRSDITSFKYFTLDNPPRFVVDLYGKWKKGARVEAPSNAVLKAVRHGLHLDKFRVVADLQPAVSVRKTVKQTEPRTLQISFQP